MTRSFDRIASTYDATRGGEERGRAFATDMHPWFATDGLTLEVGIGTGVVAKGLADLGREIVGIDIGPQMLRSAFERIGPRVAVADARVLPVHTASIDNAYSVWVLHVVDPEPVVTEVARTLRTGGRYVVCPAVPPEPDPITDIVRVMYEGLGRNAPPLRNIAGSLIDIAATADLRHVDNDAFSRQSFWESPENNAQAFEARSPSALWDVDDDTWDAVVLPTIRALRALPAPEEAIERHSITPILVFER